jgi:hypothetical protein
MAGAAASELDPRFSLLFFGIGAQKAATSMRALEALAPTHGFVRESFGDLVPTKWRNGEPAMAMAAGA